VPQQLPESVLERVRALLGKSSDTSASLLRLVFAGAESDRPLLSDVIRRFNVDVNVLHGQIDEVQGQPFGTLAVLARGAAAPLAEAIAHLRGAGVLVQEVSHA
jgi:D-methionine transport system ATP-binding protein